MIPTTPERVGDCRTAEEVVRWIAEHLASAAVLEVLGDEPCKCPAQDSIDDLVQRAQEMHAAPGRLATWALTGPPAEPEEYTVEEHPAWVDDYRYLVLDRAGAVVARCCEARRADTVARALNALGAS
jgi:hypothetical protein